MLVRIKSFSKHELPAQINQPIRIRILGRVLEAEVSLFGQYFLHTIPLPRSRTIGPDFILRSKSSQNCHEREG
jgi:hypothetical protein